MSTPQTLTRNLAQSSCPSLQARCRAVLWYIYISSVALYLLSTYLLAISAYNILSTLTIYLNT